MSDQLGAAAAALRSAAMSRITPDVLAALGDLIADTAAGSDAADAAPAATEATLGAARLIARLASAASADAAGPLPAADDAARRTC